jgi:outer membrane receptor protein involved in Fe transport
MNGFQEINVMVERPQFRAVLLLNCVLLWPTLVFAQTAAVVGTVQDQAGGVLPGVSVELRPTSGSPLVTQTDAQGAFRFDRVPPGHYVATLTLANFLSVRRDVDVAASAPTRLDVTLRVSLNTAVVVTATRTERTLEEVPASVTVLNEAVIQATPAQSLDDVIRTMPSININSDASYQVHFTANGITMRGLGSGADTRTLVMLDGVPLNGPNQGVVQWMQVPLESIDQVELVRGGGFRVVGQLRARRRHEHRHAPAGSVGSIGRRRLRALRHVPRQCLRSVGGEQSIRAQWECELLQYRQVQPRTRGSA